MIRREEKNNSGLNRYITITALWLAGRYCETTANELFLLSKCQGISSVQFSANEKQTFLHSQVGGGL